MELVFAALVAGVMGILSSLGVVWANRKNARIAVDALAYDRAESYLKNTINLQNERLSEQDKLIREQDAKLEAHEDTIRTLKGALWDADMKNKELEVRINDLERKFTTD